VPALFSSSTFLFLLFFLPPSQFHLRPAFWQHDTRRAKLCFFGSCLFKGREAPPRLQRVLRLCFQHRHRFPRFLTPRPHRPRYHRRCSSHRCLVAILLLDCLYRRNNSPMGLLRSRMRQDSWPSLSHFLPGNTLIC